MEKIPTIFKRHPEKRDLVIDDINPGCQWVFLTGNATRKYDGTCCMIDNDGRFFKRRMVKRGKVAPENFVECEHDEVTGKRFGWVPVDFDSKEDKYHTLAFSNMEPFQPGTYELCGPKIQGNPEGFQNHVLIRHSSIMPYNLKADDLTFDGLKDFLTDMDIEGIVFHNPDGRMAKIKKRDFGLKR